MSTRNVKPNYQPSKIPSKSVEECLSRIEDKTTRLFVAKALRKGPKYFWTAPSSSSGKHHPVDEHGDGGLALHTVRVFNVAEAMIASIDGEISVSFIHSNKPGTSSYSEVNGHVNPDVIRAGALLHDLYRYGTANVAELTTNKAHPEIAGSVLAIMDEEFDSKTLIVRCVERHMGRWGQVLPNSIDEWIVHFADTVATKYYPMRDSNGKA